MRIVTVLYLLYVIGSAPLVARADFELPPAVAPTFESVQNLILTASVQTATGATIPLSDKGTLSIPTNTSLHLTYHIAPGPFWPTSNETPEAQKALFAQTVGTGKLYLELWKGVPFTHEAGLVQNWDITGSTTGEVSAVFAATGPYFVIIYFPSGYYQDAQTACSNDPDWQTDCIPAYTLDQMRTYFNYGLDATTSEDAFPYLPDAFGGTAFTVSGPAVSPAAHSSVLFIPGTLTSRLYMKDSNGSERELWEPRSNLDIPLLAMNADGSSKQTIYTRDFIDQLYSNDSIYHNGIHFALNKDIDVYGSFENFMDGLVEKQIIASWRAYPYDWRYDVRDIVANGTLVGTATSSLTTIKLQDVVTDLASTSQTGKVTIIAHSNGGLIAKALAIDLAKNGKLGLLDKIIEVGTPQFGTPKSIIDLLHGDEFTELGGLVMYGDTVRTTEATMPGPYDLLPSTNYFSLKKDPVVRFDTAPPALSFRNVIGAIIDSFSKLSDFLTDAFHLDATAGLQGSTKTPLPLSTSLVAKASATHDLLDTWTPPENLSVFEIAGWGQLTPFAENYSGKVGLNCDRTNFFVPLACTLSPQLQPSIEYSKDGDDTVIAESAVGTVGKTFYLNAEKLFADTGTKIVHSSLLAAAPVQSTLASLVTGATMTSPYIATEKPGAIQNTMTVISAHSPVNILATDDAGNETGIVPVPELPGIYFEKEDIPRSSVDVIGEEKYLFLPTDAPYHITMTGYDTGTTTIDIGVLNDTGTTTVTNEFPDIPTTASTSISFTLNAGGAVSGELLQFASSTRPEIETQETASTSLEAASQTAPIYSHSPIHFDFQKHISTTSITHFSEQTFQYLTHLPEIITGTISITTTPQRWFIYSVAFVSLI